MTIKTIAKKPYTLNVLYETWTDTQNTGNEIDTFTFVDLASAMRMATEEVKWENTIHATVTDERTGVDHFDCEGDYFARAIVRLGT